MKRVLLIYSNNEKIPYPVPPLGLCYIAGSIDKKYQVEIFDGMFNDPENLTSKIKDFKPDFIGLSIRNIDNIQMLAPYCFVSDIMENFIKPIKKAANVPLILGGSGFSIFPEYLIKEFGADYGVIGEGENVFPILLDCLSNGIDPKNLERVISKNKLDYNKSTSYFDMTKQSFSKIDERINFNLYVDRSAYSIQTKRGCHHKCIYCSYPFIEGADFRPRNPKDVADEIEDVYKRLGCITFEFVDSTFNDPAGHAEEICREIIKKKIKVKLRTMGINPVNVTENLLDLMLQAGFSQIDCTPDSASPRIIKSMQKNFTFEQLKNSAGIIKKFNIPTMWFFIFGGPEENEDTVKESFDFIDKWVYEYDMVHITHGLRIYPNTILYDVALNEGVITKSENLIEPKYYISNKITIDNLQKLIKEETAKRPNCIPAEESIPSKEILKIAFKMKEKYNLDEPMFRILLKIRYKIIKNNFKLN